jgi:hypothetical protein
MHNLPVTGWLLGTFGAVYMMAAKTSQNIAAFAKDFVTIGEDQWTWTTRCGEWYEEVEIEKIEAEEVVLQHRYGLCRLAINRLSEDSRRLLFNTQKWHDHLSAGPTEGKVTPIAAATSQAEAA